MQDKNRLKKYKQTELNLLFSRVYRVKSLRFVDDGVNEPCLMGELESEQKIVTTTGICILKPADIDLEFGLDTGYCIVEVPTYGDEDDDTDALGVESCL